MPISGRRTIFFSSILAALLGFIPMMAAAVEATLTAKGASEELVERLTDASLSIAADEKKLTTSQELLAAAVSDYLTLVQVLYDEGFFSPVIHIHVDGREASSIPPLRPPANIRKITISVTTGPLFHFGQAEVVPLAKDTELPDGYRRARTATTGLIQDAARAGISGWRDQGHALADVSGQRITVYHQRAVLDAEIRLAPGPKLRFGALKVPDNSDVRPEAIALIAAFPTGEVYSPDKAQTVSTRLRRAGVFTSVNLRHAKTANPDGTLDFEVEVTDRKPRRFSFGAEISSDQGIDLSVTWLHRNLWGGAERLLLEARVRNISSSQDVDGRLSFRLDRPGVLGADSDLFYIGSIERHDETYYKADVALLAIGAKRIFSDKFYAEIAISPYYSKVKDVYGERTFRLLTLPGRAELDHRDNKIDAHKGYYLDTRLMPFLGLAGSESGISLKLDGRAYIPLGSSVVLAGRVQVGAIGGTSLSNIAPQMLFYSGGADTVRGQPYQSLGIPVGTSFSGGRSLLALSAEIRTHVTEKISIVGFYDIGFLGSGSFVNANSESHSGAGIGLRYNVAGIGPIRFDIAAPVSGTTGDGVQFYVGIGQAF
ncbi:MAG: BamA/TamA family outer membrane protein [Rhodobacteraceae bacterium]|nr:BamA/TamA family outer membrane protein [Paracoccaceae bacterium]